MSIKGSLLRVEEREDGGRTAYDRFDYQTAWGVSLLIELHKAGENYAVGFEFHDDIVCLDDAEIPRRASFYQIKTKAKGNWSFAQIVSRPSSKEGKKSSFAGKMYDNYTKFRPSVKKLAFVSNQTCSELLSTHGEAGFNSAKEEDVKKFVEAIVLESSGFDDAEHTKLFFFVFSDLNLSSYSETVLGRIALFLEEEIGAHVPPRSFALTLNDYCRRRSKSLADFATFQQLIASKFITRTDIGKWLSQAQDQHERRPEWQAVAAELQCLRFSERALLEREWRAYEFDLRNRANAATVDFTDRVRSILAPAISSAESLMGLVDTVLPDVSPLVIAWKPSVTEAYIKAVILFEFKR